MGLRHEASRARGLRNLTIIWARTQVQGKSWESNVLETRKPLPYIQLLQQRLIK